MDLIDAIDTLELSQTVDPELLERIDIITESLDILTELSNSIKMYFEVFVYLISFIIALILVTIFIRSFLKHV